MKKSGILITLLGLVVCLVGQQSRGETEESEQVIHLKEQIIRVILDTDASLLEMERERDSAQAWAQQLEDDNIRLTAQLGYLRLKLERKDLPSPTSARELSQAVQKLWDDGSLRPPSPDAELQARVRQLRERLRQTEEARKDLSLAIQAQTIARREVYGQAELIAASRERIAKLEAELDLARTQLRNQKVQAAPGQSPEALTQRIRQLEAKNRFLQIRVDSLQRVSPEQTAILTPPRDVEMRRKMDSIQYENAQLKQTVDDLRETTSRRFDQVEVNNQEKLLLERTLAEIKVREQTLRERERRLKEWEYNLEAKARRYEDLEEREVQLRMLEQKLKEAKTGGK